MNSLAVTPVTRSSIKLISDGELIVIFLGTGSAFSRKFYQTNFLVIKGDDHLLVDCGSKCSMSLTQLGIGFQDLENYYISHSHGDHIGGLEEVMLVYRYFLKRKPNIFINNHYKRLLWEESLRGGAAHSERREDNKWLAFDDFWEVNPLRRNRAFKRETWEANVGNINIKVPRTCHFPENANHWKKAVWSTGIIIDDRIFFTCDTIFDYELISEFNEKMNIEWFFHDCQFFPGGIHANLDQLNELPTSIKARTLLCHYGDAMINYKKKVEAYGFHSFARQHYRYNFDA